MLAVIEGGSDPEIVRGGTEKGGQEEDQPEIGRFGAEDTVDD